MRFAVEIHDRIAGLLEYPGPVGAESVAAAATAAADQVPAAREALLRFAGEAGRLGTGGLEELYTRTFDNCPERALEVGWQAFGETYARGAFLVGMRERLRAAGVPETAELPDHLGHVLRVLGRMPEATAAAFADGVILAAVRKMVAGFDDRENPYLGPLEAAVAVIKACVREPVAGGTVNSESAFSEQTAEETRKPGNQEGKGLEEAAASADPVPSGDWWIGPEDGKTQQDSEQGWNHSKPECSPTLCRGLSRSVESVIDPPDRGVSSGIGTRFPDAQSVLADSRSSSPNPPSPSSLGFLVSWFPEPSFLTPTGEPARAPSPPTVPAHE